MICIRKKTHEEYVAELKEKYPDIEVVDEYINAKTGILHRCRIDGYEWSTNPNNILNGRGCPVCGGSKKKTHKEYVAEVKARRPDIDVIGIYINSKTPIAHRCKKHNVIWKSSPSNILRGDGCEQCLREKISLKNSKTHDEYVHELLKKAPDITVVGEYNGAATPIPHKCSVCGYEWDARPGSILAGTGCPVCAIKKNADSKRKTQKQFLAQVAELNPDITVLDSYINANTPIRFECLIDGTVWSTTPGSILQGTGCPVCAHRMIGLSHQKTQSAYMEELLEKNPTVEVIGEYAGANTQITHHCLTHDIYWETSPASVLQGCGCPECHKEKLRDFHLRTNAQYIDELREVAPHILPLEEYIDSKTPIMHHCLTHDIKWKTRPEALLIGGGCYYCGLDKYSTALTKSHSEYVEDVSVANPDVEVIGEYIQAHIPITHRCRICGHEWDAKPSNILTGKGCPRCRESNGERVVRQWLEKHGVSYVYQKRYDDCRDVHALPFDFYLPDYNACVEFDGVQHSKPNDFFGGESSFRILEKHDKIKNQYCKDNNIRLLRINDIKDVDTELNNFLLA